MSVFTFDLHSHVNENKVTAKEFWERIKSVGIDVIAITEHADINPKIAFEKIASQKPKGIVLIPGSELNCEFGHLLAFGKNEEFYELSELFEKNAKFETCLDIAKDYGALLSISHPWGFNSDSFGYTLGFAKLEQIVSEKNVGVEIYNGMIGSISNFIFETSWIKKPVSFFDFLEKNRIARKTGLARIGKNLKKKIDTQRRNFVERCSKAIELGQKADFVTAGSDAHSADRIGEGIMKIKTDTTRLSSKNVLSELKKKENVIWSGPLVVEKQPGVFQRADKPFNRAEIIQGVKYATSSFVRRVKEKKLKRKNTTKNL